MSKAITKLRVLGQDVGVVGDDLVGRERECFGEFRPGRCQIAIDPQLDPQQQGETLLHEVLEKLTHGLGIDLEHAGLTALSNGLYAVLRDNTEAVRRILAGERIVGSGVAGGRKNA